MTYTINGTSITLQPTTGKWNPREGVGINGLGHPIYSGIRSFTLSWQTISVSDFNQLLTFFNNISGTSFVTAGLPQYDASSYSFKNYSGCVLQEPEVEQYFTEHLLNVSMLISNINTGQ